MKKKLTLSIDSKKVALLRKASARRDTSISALIEDFADSLEENSSPADDELGILRFQGAFAHLFTEADFIGSGRKARLLRETKAYQRNQPKPQGA